MSYDGHPREWKLGAKARSTDGLETLRSQVLATLNTPPGIANDSPDVTPAGGEGRSTPLLHSWLVQRGDGLILRTLSPNSP